MNYLPNLKHFSFVRFDKYIKYKKFHIKEHALHTGFRIRFLAKSGSKVVNLERREIFKIRMNEYFKHTNKHTSSLDTNIHTLKV